MTDITKVVKVPKTLEEIAEEKAEAKALKKA